MVQVELKIAGMSCQHCVGTVQGILEGLPDVSELEVEVGSARLRLASDPSPEDIGGLLDDAGFELTGIQVSP